MWPMKLFSPRMIYIFSQIRFYIQKLVNKIQSVLSTDLFNFTNILLWKCSWDLCFFTILSEVTFVKVSWHSVRILPEVISYFQQILLQDYSFNTNHTPSYIYSNYYCLYPSSTVSTIIIAIVRTLRCTHWQQWKYTSSWSVIQYIALFISTYPVYSKWGIVTQFQWMDVISKLTHRGLSNSIVPAISNCTRIRIPFTWNKLEGITLLFLPC